MLDNDSRTTRKSLHVNANAGDEAVVDVFQALASATRVSILRYLGDRVVAVNQIAQDLGLKSSTATMHITILERAGLLHTELRPASRGLQKICARTYDELVFDLPRGPHHTRDAVDVDMPIGGFSDFAVQPTCGLVTDTGLIGFLDDPAAFYEPDRLNAQLLWFRSGYVEYRFPNRTPPGARADSIQLTAEVCSEAPLHDLDWPSDIEVSINGISLGEWTCPSDFGGQRGRLTPSWWEDKDSQYGVLKRWLVTSQGTTIDGVSLSKVDLDSLGLVHGRPIIVRIGVRPDAENVGGLNLFGRGFGNYPQDLGLRIEYRTGRG
ncbi:MAG: ArsR/SmtB family transcription factor [Chloroflexota bacterium]|jgi:predicted transcriptional regulator